MKTRNLIALIGLGLFCQTEAISSPGIKYIEYHKNRIPNIVTAAGIATEIVLEEDEKIVYNTFGFEAAWNAQVVRDHILVFKSKDPQPETNLIIHTDKRGYIFTVTVGNNDWEGHPDRSNANYSLRMIYKDELAAANKKKQEELNTLRNREVATSTSYIYSNYDYRATEKAGEIIPVRIWDNGKVTFISFRAGAKRGVAYELDSNNKANLVNQNTEKNGLLIVHGIYPRLIIRLGDEAVEIRRNEKYGHRENILKTNVPRTARTIDKDAPQAFRTAPKPEPTQGLIPGVSPVEVDVSDIEAGNVEEIEYGTYQ